MYGTEAHIVQVMNIHRKSSMLESLFHDSILRLFCFQLGKQFLLCHNFEQHILPILVQHSISISISIQGEQKWKTGVKWLNNTYNHYNVRNFYIGLTQSKEINILWSYHLKLSRDLKLTFLSFVQSIQVTIPITIPSQLFSPPDLPTDCLVQGSYLTKLM